MIYITKVSTKFEAPKSPKINLELEIHRNIFDAHDIMRNAVQGKSELKCDITNRFMAHADSIVN